MQALDDESRAAVEVYLTTMQDMIQDHVTTIGDSTGSAIESLQETLKSALAPVNWIGYSFFPPDFHRLSFASYPGAQALVSTPWVALAKDSTRFGMQVAFVQGGDEVQDVVSPEPLPG